jgi:hypothetical protein
VSDDGEAREDDDLSSLVYGDTSATTTNVRPKRKSAKNSGLLLPETAIRWKGAAQRTRWLVMWRSAVMRTFDTHTRAVKVCWALEGLVAGKGHAFVGNEYLANQTGLSIKRLDETLTMLERVGAIVRTRVATRRGRSRRIYLSVGIINSNPPAAGGVLSDLKSPTRGGSSQSPSREGSAQSPSPAAKRSPRGWGYRS